MASAPARAEALCRDALSMDPENGDARLMLSEALRRTGALAEARRLAEVEVGRRPDWFGAHRQLGAVLSDLAEPLVASLAFKRALELNPAHPTLWRDLGNQLALAGDAAGAQIAHVRHASNGGDPSLQPASLALRANDFLKAEQVLNAFLSRYPNDVVALKLLSEAQARSGRADLAEKTLRRCLEIAPAFALARHSLGQLLMGFGRLDEALGEARLILGQYPGNMGARRLLAAILNSAGEYEQALEVYRALLRERPHQPTIWMSYGHVLKTLGRTTECVDAYRRGIEQQPDLGDAFWGLADLKTFRFEAREIQLMEELVASERLNVASRVSVHYALGKAHEDSGRVDDAFAQYSAGATLQRIEYPYDANSLTKFVDACIELFTPDFFAARAGSGSLEADSIFIVGLPRAGSTLIEQILSSHSSVEGTAELPDLNAIAQSLISVEQALAGAMYLEKVAGLDSSALRKLGETYLQRTRTHRKTMKPLFINKMPNDFLHVGLIQLILPNAKVIDARRHPMACGWSCFKQHFARGQTFTYDLGDIGRFYRDYVRLMAHIDAVSPGRVHRIVHEALVRDPEPHIRSLLGYCGLPFEEQCLRPHETERAVRTASSEQVRQPINTKGLDAWRKFEPHLSELRRALGDVVDSYPAAPESFSL